MQIYQDVWINGKVRQEGIRDCKIRYAAIYEHCKQYSKKRYFTVLDIGACLGYFSFRLASELPAVAVMAECNREYVNALVGPLQPGNLLSGLIRQQQCKNRLVLLNRRLTLSCLQELSKCEHFDVVLALRVVHHFKEPFADVIKAIVSLGDYTFLEIPTAHEPKVRAHSRVVKEFASHTAIMKPYDHKLVARTQSHVGPRKSPMYLITNPSVKKITKPYWKSTRTLNHTIKSTFTEKTLIKEETYKERGKLIKGWTGGINLYTYHVLNGVWPTRKDVSKTIKSYKLPKKSPLTDIAIWNFVIFGLGGLQMIDHTSLRNSRGTPFGKSNPQAKLNKVAKQILRGG